MKRGFPNGATRRDSPPVITPSVRQTRGTETSHYPEEEKTKVIAQVVASERAAAQTGPVATQAPGLKDRQQSDRTGLGEGAWKAPPQKVKGLYPKTAVRRETAPE